MFKSIEHTDIDFSSYNPNKWKDCGSYWLYETDQRDPDWLLVRMGRITGSTCGASIGNSNFSTINDTVNEIVGLKKKIFTQDQIDNMDLGTKMEPYGRQWYSNTINMKIEEVGFCVPKWNPKIGVSIDGDIIGTDGIIEIKCPKKMYKPLNDYIYKSQNGFIRKSNDFSHIWPTHYDQMQFGMAILNKKWCEYIVYCPSENKVFTQTIPFNEIYWNNNMYPKINLTLEEKISPLLQGKNIPLLPLII